MGGRLEEGRPMERFGLRNDQWERIKDVLPGRVGHVGGTAEDNRLFVEGVLYRFRTGCPWRDLPERFGYWKSVHQRFSRWAKSGVFERAFKLLASDLDNEYMMIDATIVRAHQHSAGARKKNGAQAIGRSRGGLTTKVHALVDALGNPCNLMLTPGQDHDLTCAIPLLENADPGASRSWNPALSSSSTTSPSPPRKREPDRDRMCRDV